MMVKCWWSLPWWHHRNFFAAPLSIIDTEVKTALGSFQTLDVSMTSEIKGKQHVPQFFILQKWVGVQAARVEWWKLLILAVEISLYFTAKTHFIFFFFSFFYEQVGLELNYYLPMTSSIQSIYFMLIK